MKQKIDLRNVKTCVFGIQGSGKTYLVSNNLLKNFKAPFIYEIHPEDFRHVPRALIYAYKPENLEIEKLNRVCKDVKYLAQKGDIDAFVLDEADMFIQSTLSIPTHLRDLILNHRHYGLALIFISRRPQSIPTEIVESCEHMFVFQIEGENVERKLKSIHPDFETLIKDVSKQKHNFIYKKIGAPPVVYDAIKSKKKQKTKK